ncbi:ATP-dependent RNA helicase RhlE [Cohaesibacter sp. ES.047]|uniref:DEAD/DEAH box helicase n=1 Tax=Cohaesibacter sp. ES.047 TaxID=1798205 RepID=UPI000BB68EA4|nr:DEAD/DEAH box helicase [Cohaesibacter sp. ES.047]SNY91567.1 ATP-dependent RNA helicase RhlE [Cohaesibacter sp. ES.047]
MKNFNELGLAEPILRALESNGYAEPTPIQSQAIPVALSGQDIVGIAQTGTGKTASFVLPILDRLARNDRRPTPKGCDALIIAPTRELVAQIADNIRKYSKNMRVSVTVVVGGVKPTPQIRKLASGSHIVVATPGRLLDHVSNGHLNLTQTHCVVLDEADHMLDLGFIPDIRRIMKLLPKKRQTSLLSATMPPQIRALAKDFQTDPVEVSVGAASRPIERIAQSVHLMSRASKARSLTRLLSGGEVDRAIVFTRTKRGADRVSQTLQKAGLSATAIHGNKSQGQRVRALASFKTGETTIMVATDIAARGIDIDDVSHVVNYELPEVPEAYVHRIGRTARAGREGVAISLCDPSEAKLLRDIERLIGNKLPSEMDDSYSSVDASAAEASPRARRKPSGQGAPRASSHRKGQNDDGKRAQTAKRRGGNGGRSWSPLEDRATGNGQDDQRAQGKREQSRPAQGKPAQDRHAQGKADQGKKNGRRYGKPSGAPGQSQGNNRGRRGRPAGEAAYM